MPLIPQWNKSFDIGEDILTNVNDEENSLQFKLTTLLDKLSIKID